MTGSVTASSRLARAPLLLVVGAALALSACATRPQQAARPASVTGDNPTAIDVALTPVEDLNLRKDPIPPILLQARSEGPYATNNTASCAGIAQELGMLKAVLGEDYDTAEATGRELTPEAVAQKVVAYLIPFRSVIREVSGANKHEWEFRQAISAGLMRRAYLKGRGEEMGCPYPARPRLPVPSTDPANFEDLGDAPAERQHDPRQMASTGE